MMTPEERTAYAIKITRITLKRILKDPRALIDLTVLKMNPEELQDQVYYALEYLEKTDPENNPEADE